MASFYIKNLSTIKRISVSNEVSDTKALGMFQADLLDIKRGENPAYLAREKYTDEILSDFFKLSEEENDAAYLDAEHYFNPPAVIHEPGGKIENHGVNNNNGKFE